MLASDYLLQGAVALLEKVRDGKLRLDRTIEVSVTNTARQEEDSSAARSEPENPGPFAAEQSGRFPRGYQPSTPWRNEPTPGSGSIAVATRRCAWSKS